MKRELKIVSRDGGGYEVVVEDCVETRRIDGEWFVVGTRLDGGEVRWGPLEGEAEAEDILLRIHAAQIDSYKRIAAKMLEDLERATEELKARGGRTDG